jgi:hypothetical protein
MNSDNMEDSIKQQFRSKFEGFESQPPTAGWERLEASLDAASTARLTIRRRWYAGSVAAVLVLLIGSTLLLRNHNEQPDSETTLAHTPVAETEIIVENQPKEETIYQEVETIIAPQPIMAQNNQNRRETAAVPNITVAQVEQTPKTVTEDKTEQPAVRQNDVNDFRLSEEVILMASRVDEGIQQVPQRRRRENLSIAIGGSAAATPFHTTVNTPMTLRAATSDPEDDMNMVYGDSGIGDNVSEKEHNQPVSFSATVSFPLANNLSIETGLVYTFLFSRVVNASSNINEQETQRFHYLGIPLNINYTILNINNFNLFATIGGMIEKDIRGEFRRIKQAEATTLQNFPVAAPGAQTQEWERVPISQRNPQLSVNAGVGASYPVFDRLRLFGRLGGAFYFDAGNEHRTIYSDRKIVLDLNIGIRYEF